jgi:Mrp family chromosome partitioning ATPase
LVQLRQKNAEYLPGDLNLDVQQAEVDGLRDAIGKLIDNDLTQSTKNLTNIDKLIASYQDQLKAQPAEALRVAALQRNSDQLSQFYSLLTEKAEEARISKAATIIATRVVTPSKLPHAATSPKAKITIIGGALAGFFGGIIVVFLTHTLSGRFESEEQIRRLIKLPIFGAIPNQKLIGTGANFFGPKTHNSFSESFRLVKRNLNQFSKQQKATTLLVISANERDGKTTVAANLAKAFADDGKKVAMLDCDFYLSRLPKLQAFEGSPALIEWLTTGKRAELQRWPGEAFSIIPASAFPTRDGRLDEQLFSGIIALLIAEFDYLILDSPPLPIVSDGLVLGNFADVILSVISIKNTERRTFEYHNELITGLGRPHGLVINGAEGSSYSETDAYFRGGVRRRNRFAARFRLSRA